MTRLQLEIVLNIILVSASLKPQKAACASIDENKCVVGPGAEIVDNTAEVLVNFAGGVGDKGFECSPDFGASDVVYHPTLECLVVVSDEGQVAFITLDGASIRCFTPNANDGKHRTDFEAVAYADSTPEYLYFGVERGSEDEVALIQAARIIVDNTSKQVMEVTISEEPRWEVEFVGGMVGNKGLEGLAFVPDASSAEGGSFVIGDQTAKEARAGCSVPIVTRQGCGAQSQRCTCDGAVMKPEGWREVSSIGFISDLAISSNLVDAPAADRGVLLLGSDANNELRAYHPTTGVFLDWSLHLPDSSGRGQEGMTIMGCHLYVSNDEELEDQALRRFTLVPCSCSDEMTKMQIGEPNRATPLHLHQIVINSFLSKSTDGSSGPDGSGSDWIELYSTQPVETNLTGWSICDADMLGAGKPRFVFPEDASIAAHGRLIMIADGSHTGASDTNGLLHLPFKLSKEDGVFLYNREGVLTDWLVFKAGENIGAGTGLKVQLDSTMTFNTTIPYPSRTKNVVWGRNPDGSDSWEAIGDNHTKTADSPETQDMWTSNAAPPPHESTPLQSKLLLPNSVRNASDRSRKKPSYELEGTWILMGVILGLGAVVWVVLQCYGYSTARIPGVGAAPRVAAMKYTRVEEVQLTQLEIEGIDVDTDGWDLYEDMEIK